MKKVLTRLSCNVLLLMTMAILVTGCSDESTSEQIDESEDTTKTEQAQDEQVDSELEEMVVEEQEESEESEPIIEESNVASHSDLPGTLQVGEQEIHTNGTVITIESIEFDEEFITVNVNAMNGRLGEVFLAYAGRKGMELVDDKGVTYPFLPPDDNERLKIGQGERLSGALIFLGQISGEANTLSLTFNPNPTNESDNTQTPKLSFESIEIKR